MDKFLLLSGMEQPLDDLIPTRATLLGRLKDWKDDASWQVFFDTYWRLIYSFALKNDLSPTEAEEVVQETMIDVARHMPDFKYDPAIGSFRSWLLNLTSWRICDLARRRKSFAKMRAQADISGIGHPAPTKTMEEVWNASWEKTIYDAAVENVKRRLDPKRYQIFDFLVHKEWSAEKVAKAFKLTLENVYSIKHRMSEMIKEEARRLEKEMT